MLACSVILERGAGASGVFHVDNVEHTSPREAADGEQSVFEEFKLQLVRHQATRSTPSR